MNSRSHKNRVIISICIILFLIVIVIATTRFFQASASDERQTYAAYLNSGEWKDIFSYPTNVRFTMGDLNDDGILELFLCEGSGHADQVIIISYDEQDRKIINLGSFSSFGTVQYCSAHSLVAAQYGGTGFWFTVYSAFDDSWNRSVVAVLGSAHIREEPEYFLINPTTVGENLSLYDTQGLSDLLLSGSYTVTSEDYENYYYDTWGRYSNISEIAYQDMTDITTQSIREILRQ